MVDLGKIAKGLQKNYSSATLGSEEKDSFEFVSTGNLAFDLCADGGIPWGYIVELAGKSASGKSLVVSKVIANAMKDYNAIGILADRENAYTKQRGEQLGIDNSKLILAKPKDIPTVTTGFQFLIDTITAIREQEIKNKLEKNYIVIGVDSISSFAKPLALDKADMGKKAQQAHDGLRKIIELIDDRVILMVANQVTFKSGVMYGSAEVTTCGESMKYYSTIRFALEDRRLILDPNQDNEAIGNWIGVEVVKTRLGPCHRVCFMRHLYETGIEYYSGYGRLLAHRGYLKPKNKEEFRKFNQSTLAYINDDGEKMELQEHRIDTFLEKVPLLKFDKYPPFFSSTVKEEDEEDDK
jgi:RecA/RadA recombinase